MTRPNWGGIGSGSWAALIAANLSSIAGAIGALRRVFWLTCKDITSLVEARKPSSA